jgi:hypothetical protein
MPLLLLLPVFLLSLLALALLLWPLGLWQRYRHGRARRRARPWLIVLNLALLTVAVLLFLLGAGVGGRWIDGAMPNAGAGLAAGVLLGALGLALTRFEQGVDSLHFTSPPWLVLALTLVVAVRALLGAWQAWHRWWMGEAATLPWPWLEGYASLLAMGGLLLGYHLAYGAGLHLRTRRQARRLGLRIGR